MKSDEMSVCDKHETGTLDWIYLCGKCNKFNIDEITLLKEQLDLQTALDQYKDDLIKTLQELLASKEALIAEMRERGNNE